MGQSPSLEAKSHSVTKKERFLRKLKFHYSVTVFARALHWALFWGVSNIKFWFSAELVRGNLGGCPSLKCLSGALITVGKLQTLTKHYQRRPDLEWGGLF